ncbi:Protein of unknown function [Cotesia congregata]|uniref:Uncharacterized protein n=1 Tax=Cotesia congregata TaxID=51543 RepID=A0A8J2H8I8_COTCN|nr:Protein of unknown function [Cotesia congregata]
MPSSRQGGLYDFIEQGMEQKFFNIVKNLFFHQREWEIDQQEEKEQEEEGDSQADFFGEEDSSTLSIHKTESASAHEEECFQSTYDEEEEDLLSLINLENLTPSQNSLITAVLRECEKEKILPIHLPEAEIPVITIDQDIPLITLDGEEDKNLFKEKSALSQKIDDAAKKFFAEIKLRKRKDITILDNNIVNNKFVMFGKKSKIQ